MVSFQELVERADYITIHSPLNKETRHKFNKEVFKKMKKSASLINTARGGIVKQKDLFEALINKEIKGAALDVLEQEPPDWQSIPKLKNLIITPHVAFYSESSIKELKRRTAQGVTDVLLGKNPCSLINPEVLVNN